MIGASSTCSLPCRGQSGHLTFGQTADASQGVRWMRWSLWWIHPKQRQTFAVGRIQNLKSREGQGDNDAPLISRHCFKCTESICRCDERDKKAALGSPRLLIQTTALHCSFDVLRSDAFDRS